MLNQKLPINMKNQLWIDFIDAIQEESAVMKLAISEKKDLYNTDTMDYARLLEVSDLLSIPFDVSINDTEEFLRNEVKTVAFKIKYKATIALYKSFFNVIKRNGSIYSYFYNGTSLIRDTLSILNKAISVNPMNAYSHDSAMNFTGTIEKQLKLDSGLKLDTGWNLDNATVKRNSKHLALEIFLDTSFFSGSSGSAPYSGSYPSIGLAPSTLLPPSHTLSPKPRVPYLITQEFFSYISINSEASKKVSDIVHVGCQLNALVDNSRFYDSYSGSNNFTMPALLLSSVTLDAIAGISSVNDIKYIQFGVGRKTNLPSKSGGGTIPTSLTQIVAISPILDEEKYETTGWYGVSAKYQGMSVNNFLIGTGNGSKFTFTKTLDFNPIKKGNAVIEFYSSLAKYTLTDDTFGNLVGTNGAGTINYDTGAISFTTNVNVKISHVVLGIGTGATHFLYQNDAGSRPIKTSSIIIMYIIGGTTYVATDNGIGVITGVSCTGTINYTTGAFDLTFALAPTGNIDLSYSYQKNSIPDSGTQILASYFYDNNEVYIQEAGVTDSSGNLLAYATFPRIGFKDFTNHLSMGFLIKKSNF